MKVLHFYRTYLPDTVGGIQNAIFQLCEGMNEFGVESTVLTLSQNPKKQRFILGEHQVVHAKSMFEIASTNFSLDVFGKFARLANEADIIHYHYPWPFMDVVYLAKGRHKKSIVTYHSDIVKQKRLLKYYQGLQGTFLRNVDRIVATSPDYLVSSVVLKIYREKVCIIPYGLNESAYPRPSETSASKWHEMFDKRFFLFVGVLRYYKGLQYLLEAAKRVSVPIVIAGKGPCEVELKEQCSKEGVTNVYFLGQISDEDKVSLLDACYGFVFPSHLRSEAFGISLLEAAMLGKPMITCDIESGTGYVNKHKVTGLSVPPENPQALADAMNSLLNNEDLATAFGESARARYLELFQARQMCESYYREYQKIIHAC